MITSLLCEFKNGKERNQFLSFFVFFFWNPQWLIRVFGSLMSMEYPTSLYPWDLQWNGGYDNHFTPSPSRLPNIATPKENNGVPLWSLINISNRKQVALFHSSCSHVPFQHIPSCSVPSINIKKHRHTELLNVKANILEFYCYPSWALAVTVGVQIHFWLC